VATARVRVAHRDRRSARLELGQERRRARQSALVGAGDEDLREVVASLLGVAIEVRLEEGAQGLVVGLGDRVLGLEERRKRPSR
jgi:hypothetical protein